MKKSSEPWKIEPPERSAAAIDLTLELPDGGDFDPEPRRVDPDTFIEVCEHYLPIVMARPGFWERREADRCLAEFDLADPSRVPVSYPAEFIDGLLRR
jgi:hypothetical protein